MGPGLLLWLAFLPLLDLCGRRGWSLALPWGPGPAIYQRRLLAAVRGQARRAEGAVTPQPQPELRLPPRRPAFRPPQALCGSAGRQ